MRPARWRAVLALLAVYLIWGSTYLAVKIAVVGLPPFTMIGLRNLFAGSLLVGVGLARSPSPVRRAHFKPALMTGALLIFFGNGSVAYAEQHEVASGIAALIVASIPIWMALFGFLQGAKTASDPRVVALKTLGLAIGFGGLALLVSQDGGTAAGMGSTPILVFLVAGSISWAWGSVSSRRWTGHPNALVGTGLAMLVGAVLCGIVGLATGEGGALHADAVSWPVAGAFFYLVVFGSVVAFSCYAWLLRHCDHGLVGTYAYVNPVVALALGSWLGGEALTATTVTSGLLVLGSVALVTTAPWLFARPARIAPNGAVTKP
jgi:drug/metabolite transporter (DMT)-like permease